MKSIQSFLMFFYILDQCYDYCQEDDLGGFLGAISPQLWEDGKPIDIAVYKDWKNKTNINVLNNQNIIDSIFSFIDYYERQYGYNFKETKKALINFVDDEIIAKAFQRAKRTYQKLTYID